LGIWAYQTPYEKLEKVTELLRYYNRPPDTIAAVIGNNYQNMFTTKEEVLITKKGGYLNLFRF